MQSEQKTAIINWEALKFDCEDICDDAQNKANQTFALLDAIRIILTPDQSKEPYETLIGLINICMENLDALATFHSNMYTKIAELEKIERLHKLRN